MDEINTTTTTKNPFPPRSGSKKEYAFLDHEVDLRLYRKKSQKQQNQPQPTTDDEDDDHDEGKNRNGDLIKNGGGGGGGGERKFGISLRRNFSVSAAPTYQTNGGIERQSSTRSIQGAVKRAFSLSLGRSSSVNSERYCRIYDQSSTLDDDDDDDGDCDYDDDDDFEMRNDDGDESNNGSVETRSVGQKKKKKKKKEQQNNGKKQNVGSRVLRACKRLFSR